MKEARYNSIIWNKTCDNEVINSEEYNRIKDDYSINIAPPLEVEYGMTKVLFM